MKMPYLYILQAGVVVYSLYILLNLAYHVLSEAALRHHKRLEMKILKAQRFI
jgi:hypothetical protein